MVFDSEVLPGFSSFLPQRPSGRRVIAAAERAGRLSPVPGQLSIVTAIDRASDRGQRRARREAGPPPARTSPQQPRRGPASRIAASFSLLTVCLAARGCARQGSPHPAAPLRGPRVGASARAAQQALPQQQKAAAVRRAGLRGAMQPRQVGQARGASPAHRATRRAANGPSPARAAGISPPHPRPGSRDAPHWLAAAVGGAQRAAQCAVAPADAA